MAIRTILHYPDKRLKIPGREVTEFGPELAQLVEDMAETMYAGPRSWSRGDADRRGVAAVHH